MTEIDFIKHYVANASQVMWFLGAGTSRTAGMPTATDIIWDLKLKYYCLKENQDIQKHDITNDVIKKRIQSYLDSNEFPKLWSAEEYSFYFALTFGRDYSAQQKYLANQLNANNISLNIGHRALAGLISMGKAKLIFTTNFDEVIETAYAKVSQNNLAPFHLEGSYAALEALNAETFPIYAKIHGDFKYQSVKNLSADLLNNDKKIQDCFLAACSRYGMVVTGYSGRDQNVMDMFLQAIEQHNAFPSGLFWTTPSLSNISKNVVQLIEKAKGKGLNAFIVETGTFDNMLSKIWKQVPDKTSEIDNKIRTAIAMPVSIPMPEYGNQFPILRTNALPIIELPRICAVIETVMPLNPSEVKDLVLANKPNAVISKQDLTVGWGADEELLKAFGANGVAKIYQYVFEDPLATIMHSGVYHSFFERGLWVSLSQGKPVKRKSDKGFYIYVDHKKVDDVVFKPLKEAVGYRGGLGHISGKIPNTENIYWAEAIRIKTEIKNGMFWLLLEPTILIDPVLERKNHIDFIKTKRRARYNVTAYKILDAWINILFGSIGTGVNADIAGFKDTNYPIKFKIATRTAYSKK